AALPRELAHLRQERVRPARRGRATQLGRARRDRGPQGRLDGDPLMKYMPLLRAVDPAARMRLFCLPYAGAGASAYHAWRKTLPSHIDVCPIELPGRGARVGEPFADDLRDLGHEIAGQLSPYLDRPFALAGYSMGGLIAFEVASKLRMLGRPAPQHL